MFYLSTVLAHQLHWHNIFVDLRQIWQVPAHRQLESPVSINNGASGYFDQPGALFTWTLNE